MTDQFGEYTPTQVSEVRKRKLNKAFIIQSGMSQYYVALFFYRDRKRYVVCDSVITQPRTFMSLDTAARFLRQHYVRDIRVQML